MKSACIPSMANRVTTVLVLEDHALFAETLQIALEIAGYQVQTLPITGSPEAVATAAITWRPCLALVDLDLGPHGDGETLIETLTEAGIDVVVLTASLDRCQWGGCLRRGARGIHAKTMRLPELLWTLHRLSDGLPAMSRDERAVLIEEWRSDQTQGDVLRARMRRLTRREGELLGELTDGHRIHDIAVHDVVSEATVRTQVKSILRKLEVPSQLEAVALAHRVDRQGIRAVNG